MKQSKRINADFYSVSMTPDKLCLVYQLKEDEEYEGSEDELFGRVFLVMNENLERIHLKMGSDKKLIGSNDSFLFFIEDKEHSGEMSIYDWSLEFVKSIGQKTCSNSPFYFDSKIQKKFVAMFGKYYFMTEFKKDSNYLRIIDEKTGDLVKIIRTNDFLIDRNMNIILPSSKSIKYLNLNGDLLKEIQIDSSLLNYQWFLNNRNYLYGLSSDYFFVSWNKYNYETNEVI